MSYCFLVSFFCDKPEPKAGYINFINCVNKFEDNK